MTKLQTIIEGILSKNKPSCSKEKPCGCHFGEAFHADGVCRCNQIQDLKSQLLDYFESLVKKQEPLDIPGELWDHSIGFNEAKRDLLEALEKERK